MATAGQFIPALKLNDTSFVTTMTVEQELRCVVPGRAFKPKAKIGPLEQRMVSRTKAHHELIQRAMSGRKASNAKHDLPDYIVERVLESDQDGPLGDLGPSIIYTPDKLEIVDNLVDISNVMFVYEDGESRGEAFLNVLENGTSDEKVRAMLALTRPLVVQHGFRAERGAAFFGDYNGKGVPVTGNLMIARDQVDPFAVTSREVFDGLGLELELEKRQVSTRTSCIMTAHAARIMVAAQFLGITAVSYGASKLPTTTSWGTGDYDLDVAHLYEVGSAWVGELLTTFGADAFTDKAQVLRSAPVLVALGTIGRSLYFEKTTPKKIMDAIYLEGVNWKHDSRAWDGIAGKRNAADTFSVSSGKEAAHAVLAALTDQTNAGYGAIRK